MRNIDITHRKLIYDPGLVEPMASCLGSTRPGHIVPILTSHLTGIELIHMLRKGQLEDGVEQGLSAAEQFYALAS